MEWVETTAKTVEHAKQAALAQLGIDETDAEFEVLEEPRTGLFGRTRGDARVRARVRPVPHRPKVERRERRGRNGRGDGSRGDRNRGNKASKPAPGATKGGAKGGTPVERPATTSTSDGATVASKPPRRRRGGQGGGRDQAERAAARPAPPRDDRGDDHEDKGNTTMTETELLAQGALVQSFLRDLVDAFGVDGEVSLSAVPDDGAVELAVTGDDLGLLIGPKGQTLQAVQELSRSVLQRHHPGEDHARVRVDVGGYRQRRRDALERFVRQVAEEVRASGAQKALEPMSPPDRKVVHDTVNAIDGVSTLSEGEDTQRRVVILPDG